jgi:hypothetical protein
VHKLLTFFNLQNDNKLIKESQKIIYDSIAINQVFYVPMIAKVLDMEESQTYDCLDDEQVLKLASRKETLREQTSFHTRKH